MEDLNPDSSSTSQPADSGTALLALQGPASTWGTGQWSRAPRLEEKERVGRSVEWCGAGPVAMLTSVTAPDACSARTMLHASR